jgi:bifunctional non-homologous end joining protein LigD
MSYRRASSLQYVVDRKKLAAKPRKAAFPYGKPRKIEAMLAEEGRREDIAKPEYHEQRKYDGTRTFIIKDGDRVVMRGRSWINDYAPLFPEIVAEVRKLPVHSAVLDSELTFFKAGTDKDVFITALARPETKKGYTAKAMVFDVLFAGDESLKNVPFKERMKTLEKIVPERLQHVDVVETVTKDKEGYYRAITRKAQGEGVVLKERNSPYREGERTFEWLKVKNFKSDEAVVVGYTEGKGQRESALGSLVLAQRDREGNWRLVGKTSGFSNEEMLKFKRRIDRMKVAKSPLVGEQPEGVKAWCRPKMVVEVKYYERTPSGVFRFPDFIRERTDKKPEECTFKGT